MPTIEEPTLQGSKLNKKQASEILEKSARTIATYVKEGKLKCSYVNGKNGLEAVYDEDDVRRLKTEMETPAYRAVVDPEPATQTTELVARRGFQPVRYQSQGDPGRPLLQGRRDGIDVMQIAVKPLLKLSEAQSLTGMSRGSLLTAIQAGHLTADSKKWGRGWRMRRTDLDRFIANY